MIIKYPDYFVVPVIMEDDFDVNLNTHSGLNRDCKECDESSHKENYYTKLFDDIDTEYVNSQTG